MRSTKRGGKGPFTSSFYEAEAAKQRKAEYKGATRKCEARRGAVRYTISNALCLHKSQYTLITKSISINLTTQ